VWVVDLTTDVGARGPSSFSRVTGSNTWTTFNPDVTIGGDATPGSVPFTAPLLTTTWTDVEVSDDAANTLVCPTTLSDALAGGKLKTEGGSRLLLVPASADIAAEVMKDRPLPRGGEGSLLLLQLTPLSVSKKKEKKTKSDKEKKKADKSAAAGDDGVLVNDTEDDVVPEDSSSSSASSSSASAAASFQSWSSELSSTLAPLLPSLQLMNEQVSSTAAMQQKIIKFLMTELYEGLIADLGLQPALDAQTTAADAEATTAAVDPVQAAQLVAVQTRVRSLVSGFVEKNTVEHKGTLAALVQAWKVQLLPALHPLVQPSGLLSESRLQAIASTASSAGGNSAEMEKLKAQISKLTATHAATVKKLDDANRTLHESLEKHKKSFFDLDTKHTALVMKHVDLEDANTKLAASNVEVSKKAQMCTVFEAGLSDLRTMLEHEIDEKQKIQTAWDHLSQFQKNYKLTWLPDKAATNCMRCTAKFSMFGSKSKGTVDTVVASSARSVARNARYQSSAIRRR
jgi:hypothetical protein